MEDKENLNNDDLMASSMFSSGGEESSQMSSMFDEPIPEDSVSNIEEVETVSDVAPSMFDETIDAKEEINTNSDVKAEEETPPEENKPEKEPVQVIDVTDEDDTESETTPNGVVTVRPVKFKKFEATEPTRTIKKNLDIMQDISMHISVELGRTKLSIKEVMDFEQGSIVELDKIAGEQVEVYVNEKLVAKGEVIVIEDRFGVRITSTNVSKSIINP